MERLPTLKQLQYLAAVTKAKHFGRAAAALGVTQSTLSAGLQELEEIIGAKVIDRSARQALLTPAGVQLTQLGGRILSELRDVLAEIREQAPPLSGTLRLGVIPTISAFLLPRLLPGLRSRYPKLKLYLIEAQTADLLAQLERGELDILLLALPCACEGESEVLARDDFLTALPRVHPLAKQKEITAEQLKQAKLLTLQDGHCLRDQILSACGLRVSGDERHAATSLHTLVQMVDNGLGITLLPQLAVRAGLLANSGLVTRPVQGRQAYRDIALLWRYGAPRSEEFRLLAKELRRLFRG
jgi:LysR family transcriptional regulator, hydrogen peroxide-inducible genes activator